jgi:hypothetical protein
MTPSILVGCTSANSVPLSPQSLRSIALMNCQRARKSVDVFDFVLANFTSDLDNASVPLDISALIQVENTWVVFEHPVRSSTTSEPARV